MTDHLFSTLPDRGKEPTSKRNLDAWIQQAQSKTGVAVGRLGWLVASSVVIAALQRTRADDGHPRFLLKGGAYLEVRLGMRARATKDIDTLFRGDFDEFLDVLDTTLTESWGGDRTGTHRCRDHRTSPTRYQALPIQGQTSRERSDLAQHRRRSRPRRGSAGAQVDLFAGPPLEHFGLPSPVEVAGIVFDYQVAHKLHACTDPHEPPDQLNDRARDLVDLLLIRDTFYTDDSDLDALRAACADVFAARAVDAKTLDLEIRH